MPRKVFSICSDSAMLSPYCRHHTTTPGWAGASRDTMNKATSWVLASSVDMQSLLSSFVRQPKQKRTTTLVAKFITQPPAPTDQCSPSECLTSLRAESHSVTQVLPSAGSGIAAVGIAARPVELRTARTTSSISSWMATESSMASVSPNPGGRTACRLESVIATVGQALPRSETCPIHDRRLLPEVRGRNWRGNAAPRPVRRSARAVHRSCSSRRSRWASAKISSPRPETRVRLAVPNVSFPAARSCTSRPREVMSSCCCATSCLFLPGVLDL